MTLTIEDRLALLSILASGSTSMAIRGALTNAAAADALAGRLSDDVGVLIAREVQKLTASAEQERRDIDSTTAKA